MDYFTCTMKRHWLLAPIYPPGDRDSFYHKGVFNFLTLKSETVSFVVVVMIYMLVHRLGLLENHMCSGLVLTSRSIYRHMRTVSYMLPSKRPYGHPSLLGGKTPQLGSPHCELCQLWSPLPYAKGMAELAGSVYTQVSGAYAKADTLPSVSRSCPWPLTFLPWNLSLE